MSFLSRSLAVAALVVASASASAAVVLSATGVSGNVRLSGFGTIGVGGALPDTGTFTADLTNLAGHVEFQALPDGNYTVSEAIDITLTGFGPDITSTIPSTPIYTGFLGSTGLTPGSYAFDFGSSIGAAVPFGFSINYDGNASSQVMAALSGLGFPFVNPDGAGTLTVAGTLNADGKTASLVFTESALTWSGFANTLALADLAGGNNDVMDGSFVIRSATVTAVPEPATLSLMGLSLVGLAYSRRRRNAA